MVRLSHSKTDPFGARVNLYLGRTGDTLCPVGAVLGYLAIRPSTPGPLFHFQDGTPLSRAHLVDLSKSKSTEKERIVPQLTDSARVAANRQRVYSVSGRGEKQNFVQKLA